MSFQVGILSFTDLRTLFKEIQCDNIVPYNDIVVRTTVNFPSAFYNIPSSNEHKVFVNSNDLIHVIYISTVYSLQEQLSLPQNDTPFVLVVKAYDIELPTPLSTHLSISVSEIVDQIEVERKTIEKWEDLLEDPSSDSVDSKRDAELEMLSAAVRQQLVLDNNPKPLNAQILRLLHNDWNHMKTSSEVYQRLTDAVNVKATEKLEVEQTINVSENRHLIPAPSLQYVTLGHESKTTTQSTEIAVRDEVLDEHMLNRLKDFVSIFIRATCGSIDMKMIEAFIIMPPIRNMTHNKRAFEEYINALTTTVRAAVMQTDIWIRDFSHDITTISEVASNFGNSQDGLEYRIFYTSTVLCGQFIRGSKADNPMRGLHTRFSIPENQRNVNDALDNLESLLRSKYGAKRGRSSLNVTEDTRWRFSLPSSQIM